jgi:hypothetical protein
VWRGVAWRGVAWRGVVWCGVVWCGVVWCGVVWCGLPRLRPGRLTVLLGQLKSQVPGVWSQVMVYPDSGMGVIHTHNSACLSRNCTWCTVHGMLVPSHCNGTGWSVVVCCVCSLCGRGQAGGCWLQRSPCDELNLWRSS